MIARFLLCLALALPAALQAASGQVVRERPGMLRPNRRLPAPEPGQRATPLNARRQQVEQQIRRTFWRVAKRRIGFTDDQMSRLERTSQRFDQRRRVLAQQEKALRVSLRAEIVADTAANQGVISTALDQLHVLQRQRLDLQEEEQRELSAFMTPLQRGKFLALQEQVRRRMLELVRARPDTTLGSLGDP